jgi:MAF protein
MRSTKVKIILASQSPFRKYALDLLGLDYEVMPSDIDEKSIRDDNPRMLAQKLAEAKAVSVAGKYSDAVIVASDAVVSVNGRIFEKPSNEHEAFAMLNVLSGNSFEFITGLAVHNCSYKTTRSTVQGCTLKFRSLLESEIRDYIGKNPVLQCAGAFEHDGVLRFAEEVSGSYNFRTAIPVNELVQLLREQGISV